MTATITELALRTREAAAAVVDRHVNPNQKKSSLALYDVLGSCMALCERCERDPAERDEIGRLFAEQPHQNVKGRWVEKGSDIYVLVCRFIFTDTDRTNAMRYACALREASKMQIGSRDLPTWLGTEGGINALYFRRPLDARTVKTRTLRLAATIAVSRDDAFRLTLRWKDDNSFVVLSQEPA